MGKIYKGNVGIKPVEAKDGSVTLRLKSNVDGAFNSENASDLFAKALEATKSSKLPLFSYSFYVPSEKRAIKQSDAKSVADGKLVPVLQADKFGKPSLRLLPPMAEKSGSTSKKFDWIA